jgi:hypothetical protein
MTRTGLSSTVRMAFGGVAVVVLLGGGAQGLEGQEGTAATFVEPAVERPVPAPVVPPPFMRRALEAGTRSPDGSPGPAYWQNRADYEIDVRLDPASARLTGSETIRYLNRSPDDLPLLLLHLHQNLHAPGVVRNEAQEITGGVELGRVRVDGTPVRPASEAGAGAPVYVVQGQIMALQLPSPVASGDSVLVEIDWEVTLPQSGAGRMGYSEREVYFVAYWFPRVAVYDDLRGWDAQPYQGGAEFYDGFGDYRVSITVPGGWTVMGTGELENPAEVFSAGVRERLAAAAEADTVVAVATREDREAGRVTVEASELTYRFHAENVRDFAFTASDVQRWDATSARVPDRPGEGAADRVMIHAFWRPDRAPLWADQALYGKHAVEHHSAYTGIPYPWPHMTSVEGADIIGGGMEFPMLTVMGSYQGRDAQALYNVTSHEIAHMWVPMIVGTNEKRYAWMDEGSTSFLENQGRPDYWPGTEAHREERQGYLAVARAEAEQPLMRHGDYYEPGPGYGTASYAKPATLLVTLRALLGEETFETAYRRFLEAWAYGHPTPWDLFNTFETVAGRDLDWFWTSFYEETWRLDQAVEGVEDRGGIPVVVVVDRGFAPMPVRLRIETSEAGTLERELPATVWLDGSTRVEVELPADVGRVTAVEIDPERAFPDVDRANNRWEPSGGPG